MIVNPPICLLIDNGSLRPAATFTLRRLASTLSAKTGFVVEAVSLLHSNRISKDLLDGRSAEIFVPALKKRLEVGYHHFVVLPLFFGPSAALTRYIPKKVADLKQSWPDLNIRIAPCLVNVLDSVDTRMAHILADLVRLKIAQCRLKRPAIILVDHGTPTPAVNAVRDFVTEQLAALLGDAVRCVTAASMERRPGRKFDFNEPLLENLLGADGFVSGDTVLAMLFLSPGRHAGAEGDIAQICTEAIKKSPKLKVHMTDLVSSHPGLIDILAERLQRSLG